MFVVYKWARIKKTLPNLQHDTVDFLLPNTRHRLQPLFREWLRKRRFVRKIANKASSWNARWCALEVYNIKVLSAICWFLAMRSFISERAICNYWGTTGTLSAMMLMRTAPSTPHIDVDKIASLENFVRIVIPNASQRVTEDELVSWHDQVNSAQVYSNDGMISNIVSACAKEACASATRIWT